MYKGNAAPVRASSHRNADKMGPTFYRIAHLSCTNLASSVAGSALALVFLSKKYQTKVSSTVQRKKMNLQVCNKTIIYTPFEIRRGL